MTNTNTNALAMEQAKVVYQARPVNCGKGMVYNGFLDTADQRPVEELKAEIEAKTGIAYDMEVIIDITDCPFDLSIKY